MSVWSWTVIVLVALLNVCVLALVWWLDRRDARRERRSNAQTRLDAYRRIVVPIREAPSTRARRLHVDELQLDEDFSGFAEMGRRPRT